MNFDLSNDRKITTLHLWRPALAEQGQSGSWLLALQLAGAEIWGPKCERAVGSENVFIIEAITSGTFLYGVKGAVIAARRGDIILIPPSLPVTSRVDGRRPGSKRFYAVSTSTTDFLNIYGLDGHAPHLLTVSAASFRGLLNIKHLETTSEPQASLDAAERILRIFNEYAALKNATTDERHTRLEMRLNDEGNWPDANEIAEIFGVSVPQANRIFRQRYGVSPGKYVLELKLRRALLYVTQTEESIGSIAARLGYANQNYFSNQFKERFGVSPLEKRAGADRYRPDP